MPSETNIVIGWFYREAFASGTLEFDELLYQAARIVLGKSDADTEAYLVKNRVRVWNELLKNLDWDTREGRLPIFEIQDIYGRKLKWTPGNYEQTVRSRDKYIKFKLSARPHILKVIDGLTDRQYEVLACLASESIGATNVLLTPPGNERGIDFLATIDMPGKCHVFGGNQRLFRIVGQAKKYERKVEFKEIQRLNETLNEVKYQSPPIQRFIPPWFKVASGPIIGWLVAHNGVQGGGISYARNHGIIISDSVDLAEILALSKLLDISLMPSQRAEALIQRITRYPGLN